MKKILEKYKVFEDVKEVVDVGGGIGTAMSIITSKYPAIKGINFDLPHVIEHAPSFPGVKHVGGDMFKSIPKGELNLMKSILHGWGDESCSMLLKKCYDALPGNRKLVIVERILPVAVEIHAAAKYICHADLIMMTQTPGGKERTDKEWPWQEELGLLVLGKYVVFVITGSWSSANKCETNLSFCSSKSKIVRCKCRK